MPLYNTTSGDIIKAKSPSEATRIAMRQGSGTVLGEASQEVKDKRAKVYALTTANDKVAERILKESTKELPQDEIHDALWYAEMGLVEAYKEEIGSYRR